MPTMIIIYTVGFLFILLYLALLVRRRFNGTDLTKYSKKACVLNQSEFALYLNLRQSLGEKYIVLSKVRIEDFVEVKKIYQDWRTQNSLRNRIKSRHVDFLICRLVDSKPLLAIELDGASHKNIKTIYRDDFINNLYKFIDLPIIHIRVGDNFFEITQLIQKQLGHQQ